MTSIGLVACIRIQGVVTTHPHHSIDMTPLARRYILRAASYICICIQPYKHSPRCTQHTHLYASICYFYLCIRITICSVHTCTPRATYCSHKHHTSKRDLLLWQKRPTYMAKETCLLHSNAPYEMLYTPRAVFLFFTAYTYRIQ
jgi:hypothetical protein